MDFNTRQDLIDTFNSGFTPLFSGTMEEWFHENIYLPAGLYNISGQCDLSGMPYLKDIFAAIQDPSLKMINLIASPQSGKSLATELCIPYWVCEHPGKIIRYSQTDDVAGTFAETRLIPLLRACKPTSKFLNKRSSAKRRDILFPHMSIKMTGASESTSHSLSARYLILDEAHLYDVGFIEKAITRTLAYIGKRKIIVASTPNDAGSELHKYYNSGHIYQWHIKCPHCQEYQPWYWSRQRDDKTFAGINWDTILNPDGETTDVAKSAATAYWECLPCRKKVIDNIVNRRIFNDTGKFICIKADGDKTVRSYNWPIFVNINLTFESAATQFMAAIKTKKLGLDEDLKTFNNQVMGRFYKAESLPNQSKIMLGEYDAIDYKNKTDWINILSVDCQRKGLVKYFVVRSWKKDGVESKLLDFGICRSWKDLDTIQAKWKINNSCVGLDSGDGEMTAEVYRECLNRGKVVKLPTGPYFDCWIPLKGDKKLSWPHPDKINRYYSPVSKQDPMFPVGHKLKGIPAPLLLWSNYSIKTLLVNLRDNKTDGIQWQVSGRDSDYEQQLYSEGIYETVNKKSGLTEKRWIKQSDENHFFDAECMNLVLAIRANIFSPIAVSEIEIRKMVPNDKLE